MKVYLLKIWGNLIGIYDTVSEADRIATELAVVTSEDGRTGYCEYRIEEWIIGNRTYSAIHDREFTKEIDV